MDYATYKKLNFSILNQDEFEEVITKSEILISNLTRDFYQLHNLEDDLDSSDKFIVYRAIQYQKAICLQCEYAHELGAAGLLGQQQTGLTDVQIGRTHIQRNNNAANSVTLGKSGVIKEAADLLGSTGLLYRGVDVL